MTCTLASTALSDLVCACKRLLPMLRNDKFSPEQTEIYRRRCHALAAIKKAEEILPLLQ